MGYEFKPYPFTAKRYEAELPALADGAETKRHAVAIVGGGPVGLALALGLANHGVPSVLIEADAGMIGQALTNLLKNAGEAVAETAAAPPPDWAGRVGVTLEATPEVAVLRISDNGTGLPEDRSRLFEPYVTLKSGGTGLGLPIVKKIIEEHGGTLTLEDNHPRGAVAEIRLPRHRANVSTAAHAPRQKRLEQETAGAP